MEPKLLRSAHGCFEGLQSRHTTLPTPVSAVKWPSVAGSSPSSPVPNGTKHEDRAASWVSASLGWSRAQRC